MSEMAAWLVVWPIAIPLIGASLAIVLWGRPNAQGAIGLIAMTLQFMASLALLGHVWANGPIAMSMGGWPAPFGIAMAADILSAALTAASLPCAPPTARRGRVSEFGFHRLVRRMRSRAAG